MSLPFQPSLEHSPDCGVQVRRGGDEICIGFPFRVFSTAVNAADVAPPVVGCHRDVVAEDVEPSGHPGTRGEFGFLFGCHITSFRLS